MAAGTATESGTNARSGATRNAPASDEEILGIDTAPKRANGRAEQPRSASARGTADGPAAPIAGVPAAASRGADGDGNSAAQNPPDARKSSDTSTHADERQARQGIAEPEELRAAFEANPELRRAWLEAQAYREAFPTVEAAREVQKIFPTVEDAQAAREQLDELGRLDSLFFARTPEAHASLASAVYRLDPEAFRSLARAMAAEAQRRGDNGVALTAAAREGEPSAAESSPTRSTAPSRPSSERESRTAESPGDKGLEQEARAAQTSFYQEANATAVEAVIETIRSQVERLLPEDLGVGARNRVIGEIYRELDSSLRSNRALAQQVRQAFRSGNFDADHQRAVVSLIVGRARQAVPGVAKKVINEWTSSVLAASNTKHTRQRAAESRVDITGAGAPGGVARRPLAPSDIDYSKLSDADILNL
jgi:hypothetical protein